MSQVYLQLLIIGIAAGSVYAIAAMGLVLTYKISGILNFGHGAVAATAAYLFYELHVLSGFPWPVALALTIVVVALAAGLLMELLARYLAEVPIAYKIVGTVGLLLLVRGAASLRYGALPLNVPAYFPVGNVGIVGVNVRYEQIIITVIALVSAAALFCLFRYTRLGTSMRAVVDDPDLLDMAGTDPVRTRRGGWVIGCAYAALSGVLLSRVLGLDPDRLTLLVIAAFGAAAIGAFSNLTLTYVGGLVLGVLEAFTGRFVASTPSLQQLPSSLAFILLFAVLLLLGPSRLKPIGRMVAAKRLRSAPRNARTTAVIIAAALLFMLLVPLWAGVRQSTFTAALSYVVLFLSLSLLVRTSNQVSLCQVGFMAVGSAVLARLTAEAGVPWLLAVLLAGLAAVPLGILVAVPAVRLSGVYLALATFGFAILLDRVGYPLGVLFGNEGALPAARPRLLGLPTDGDAGYYYVVLLAVILSLLLVVVIVRSRLGRLLNAMADSPLALTTHGANINLTKLIVFCLSSFLAGVAGALYAPVNGFVDSFTFPAFNSLTVLTVLMISGRGTLLPPIVAALGLIVAPSYLGEISAGGLDVLFSTDGLQMLFGAAAILVAVSARPRNTAKADTPSGDAFTTGRGRSPLMAQQRTSSPVRARSLSGPAPSADPLRNPTRQGASR